MATPDELFKTACKHMDRQDAGIVELLNRVAELEEMAREMILAVPGGSVCDPQIVADTLRKIAGRHGVRVE
jgi:hypothetical protein